MSVSGVSIGSYAEHVDNPGPGIITAQDAVSARTINRYNLDTATWSTITWPATVSGQATATFYDYIVAARRDPNIIWAFGFSIPSTQPIIWTEDGGSTWFEIPTIADELVDTAYSLINGVIPGPEGDSLYIAFCCDVDPPITDLERKKASSIWRIRNGLWTRVSYNEKGYADSPLGGCSGGELYGQGVGAIGLTPTKVYYASNYGQVDEDCTILTSSDLHSVSMSSPLVKTHFPSHLGYPYRTAITGAPDGDRAWLWAGNDPFDDDATFTNGLIIRIKDGVASDGFDPDFVNTATLGGVIDLGGGVVLAWANSEFGGASSTGTLWRSTNYGVSWTAIAPFISSTVYKYMDELENCFVVDPVDSNFVYLATESWDSTGAPIWESIDKGLTWTLLTGFPMSLNPNGGFGTFSVSRARL